MASGSFTLNLAGAPCGRLGCGHRRDAHATRHDGSHRWECEVKSCDCLEFVIGGEVTEHDPDEDFSRLADSSKPPPP